jgi:ribosomal protein S10
MKIKIYLKSNKYYLLKTFIDFFTYQSRQTGHQTTLFFLPTKTFRISLFKSPHVYKKHKDHYSLKTFACVIHLSGNEITIFNVIKHCLNQKPVEISYKIIYQK